MLSDGHPERLVVAPVEGRPARRHDTFAVLDRAQAAVARAERRLGAAREDAALARRASTARTLSDATVAKLREVLG